jgi:FixJ family two-component response regulator
MKGQMDSKSEQILAAGARICVIDDDASMRSAITTLIGSHGLEAEGFSSAEEFLGSGRCRSYDCLILDVRMPGMGGLELQRRLITDENALPVVFITAHFNDDERDRAGKAGAVAFLRKPFTEAQLVNAIDISLRKNFAGKPDASLAPANVQR